MGMEITASNLLNQKKQKISVKRKKSGFLLTLQTRCEYIFFVGISGTRVANLDFHRSLYIW